MFGGTVRVGLIGIVAANVAFEAPKAAGDEDALALHGRDALRQGSKEQGGAPCQPAAMHYTRRKTEFPPEEPPH